MAEDFLTPTGTCHLFPRWHSFKGFALTLIGSNGNKSLCSTLPKNPDLGFQSKVIPFSRSNHHVTKYGCFHLAQSRQRWCTFDGNSHGICSNTPAVFDRIRSNSPNSSNYFNLSIVRKIVLRRKKRVTHHTSHGNSDFRETPEGSRVAASAHEDCRRSTHDYDHFRRFPTELVLHRRAHNQHLKFVYLSEFLNRFRGGILSVRLCFASAFHRYICVNLLFPTFCYAEVAALSKQSMNRFIVTKWNRWENRK